MGRRWTLRLALSIGMLAAICAAYANSFHNGFHFDDFHTVIDNPAVRSLANVPRFFEDATTFSVLPPNRTYRPVVSASLALDYALGHGYIPLWFHVSTFLLFLVLVLLLQVLYGMVMEKTHPSPMNLWLAWFGAAWFGLHPAMAETINYVIQRGDLYCTLGSVAALVVFARYPRLRRTGIYVLPLVFALLSKPPAAVLPVLLFFYIFFFEAREKRVCEGLLAALPSAVVVGLLLWLQSTMTPKSFMPTLFSPWDYRMTQPFVWMRYVGEFFLPVHLNVDSDLGPLPGLDARVIGGLIFVVLMGVAIGYTARRRRLYPIAFGLIWFVVTQLPTSLYALSEMENDHRMFFSFVGLLLAVVWTGWVLVERFVSFERRLALRPAAMVMAVLTLATFGYGVHRRNQVWLNEETLWRDDVEKSPHNGRGLMIYGLTQMNKGAYPVALDYFTRALAFTPNYATLEINLGIVKGAIADESGRDARDSALAQAHFQRAIMLDPEDDTTHAYYGRWLKDHARLAEAIKQLHTAIALNPQRAMQRDELIEAYAAAGDVSAALQTSRQALAVIPDDGVAHQTLAHPPAQTAAFWINLSLAQFQSAEYTESVVSAQRALQLDPESAEAWNNLGAASAALHRWDDAIAAAQKAIALKPEFQLARNNLAWAMAQKRLAVR
jgi:protein O-mannosyl-transferase